MAWTVGQSLVSCQFNVTLSSIGTHSLSIPNFHIFPKLRVNRSVFSCSLESCRNGDRGYALAADLVWLLKEVQLQHRVSLCSLLRQASAYSPGVLLSINQSEV